MSRLSVMRVKWVWMLLNYKTIRQSRMHLVRRRRLNSVKPKLKNVFAYEKFEHYTLGKEVIVKSDRKPFEMVFKKIFVQCLERLQRM